MDELTNATSVERKFCTALAECLCLIETDFIVSRLLRLVPGAQMEGQCHCEDKGQGHCVVEEEYTIAVPLVRPKPPFLSVLRLAGATNEVFTKKEILHYLKLYIVSRQMFDMNNPSVVHCQDDLLGDVFGVSQFSICDVLKLLGENCTPLPDTHLQRRRRLVSKPSVTTPPTSVTTVNSAANQTSSPVISSTSSGEPTVKPIPHTKRRKSSSGSSNTKVTTADHAKPSSSHKKGQSSTSRPQGQPSSDSSETDKCTSSRKRKRKDSGSSTERTRRRGTSLSITYNDDGDKDAYPWYFQLELGDRSENEHSEVLSVQGKETVVVQDSTDDMWFLEEDSVAVEVPSDAEFSIEYDVESDTAPGTESDLSSVRSGESILVVCKESDVEFFADCSDTDNSDDDKELTEADNWSCTECNQSNPPVQRYCGRCWKLRADWLSSQCKGEEKPLTCSASKHKDNTERNSAAKVEGEVDSVYDLTGKDDKLFSFDSGVGSLSSVLPSSQETVSSDISVFCNTPDLKSIPCISDTRINLCTKEAQLMESRHSFANIQLKPKSENSANVNNTSVASSTNCIDAGPKAPSTALDDPCMICLTQPKTASLVHGTSGHQVCCFSCGKRLRRRGKLCPVCRRPIQKVIRNYIL